MPCDPRKESCRRTIPCPGLSRRPSALASARTIEVAVYLSTLCLFLAAILKLRFEQARGLIPFFLTGVVCNMVAALVQYSFARTVALDDILPYVMRTGFFANENHFSALVFVSIPLAFACFPVQRRPGLLLVYLVFSLLTLFAVGSRAGVIIGLAVTAMSAIAMWQRGSAGIASVLSGVSLAGIFAMIAWNRFLLGKLVSLDVVRMEAIRTTLDGIADNPAVGRGLRHLPHRLSVL